MNKISRNDLCPCGSGIKYKRCCINKVLAFPNSESSKKNDHPSSQNDFMEKVKEHFKDKKFESHQYK